MTFALLYQPLVIYSSPHNVAHDEAEVLFTYITFGTRKSGNNVWHDVVESVTLARKLGEKMFR